MRTTALALLLLGVVAGSVALADTSLPGRKKDWPTNEQCGAKAAPTRCEKWRTQHRAELEKAAAQRKPAATGEADGGGRLVVTLPASPTSSVRLAALLVFLDGAPVLDLCEDARAVDPEHAIEVFAGNLPAGSHVIGVRADVGEDQPRAFDGTISVGAGATRAYSLQIAPRLALLAR